MVVSLLIPGSIRKFALAYAAKTIHERDLDIMRLNRSRVYLGVALVALGLYVAWLKHQERQSKAQGIAGAVIGGLIAWDGYAKLKARVSWILKS